MKYSELQVTTNFSFLRGASHPEEFVEQAAEYGYASIAITDRNSLAGIVRAHVAARSSGIRLIPGCRLDLLDGPSLLAYPIHIDGYSQLSGLLTKGNLRAEKGDCHLYKADVYEQLKDNRLIVVPPDKLNHAFEFDYSFEKQLKEYKEYFGPALYLGITRRYFGDDAKQLFRLSQLAMRLNIPMVATNDACYHEPGATATAGYTNLHSGKMYDSKCRFSSVSKCGKAFENNGRNAKAVPQLSGSSTQCGRNC